MRAGGCLMGFAVVREEHHAQKRAWPSAAQQKAVVSSLSTVQVHQTRHASRFTRTRARFVLDSDDVTHKAQSGFWIHHSDWRFW